MEKIKALELKKKGILDSFLYNDVTVQAGDQIAFVTSDDNPIIITAPQDGIIIKPIAVGSKIKSSTVIAKILTTPEEIEKYYQKQNGTDEFSHLDKDGVSFSTLKDGEFGTKWADVEEDNYSGAGIIKADTSKPKDALQLTSILNPEKSQDRNYENNYLIPEVNTTYNEEKWADDSRIEVVQNDNNVADAKYNEEILANDSTTKEISNENYDADTNVDRETEIFDGNDHQLNNLTSNNFYFDEGTKDVKSFEQNPVFTPIAHDIKVTETKRWDENELSFGPQKISNLSFKSLHPNERDIVSNRTKIQSIDKVSNNQYQQNNHFANSNANTNQYDSVKVHSPIGNQNAEIKKAIIEAVPTSTNVIKRENQEKEYAKYLINETKDQDQGPISAANLFGSQDGNNSFRTLVNSRRGQLHENNDFHELSLENDGSKSAMDYLDEFGRPKILRNIVQGRLNDLVRQNATSDVLMAPNVDDLNQPMDSTLLKSQSKAYANLEGNVMNENESKAIQPAGYYSPLKSYRERLYEKLNDGGQRERILKTRNQRELIKKRMEEISKGNVVYDSVIGGINNNRRPTLEETELQYEILEKDYNKDHPQFNDNSEEVAEFNSYPGIETNRVKEPLVTRTLSNSETINRQKNIFEDDKVVKVPLNSNSQDSAMLVELAILKEKMSNQDQNTRQSDLMREIQSLKETNGNKSSDNSFDKMMQYMIIQQMMKTANGVDPVVAQMFKESFLPEKNNLILTETPSLTNDLSVKKFDQSPPISNTYGNLLQPINNHLNIVNTNAHIEPQGLETREDIKQTRYPAIKSMIMSQLHVPPLTINTEIDMSAVIDQQRKLKNANSDNGVRFSTMSFIVKSVSLALNEYPKLNSYYDPKTNQIVIKNSHHIGVATETSEGLVIPVIKFSERLSLKQVAINIQETIDRLRQGELYDYELLGSTITIANYGTVGALNATPTIFYPNSAVIGIGRIVRKPIVIKGDKLVIRSMMNISLTVDQRIIDAAEAGIFLSRLKETLESPELITVS